MITNFNTYNESLRDKLKGKSLDDVKSALLKMSPHGMSDRLRWEFGYIDGEYLSELEKLSDERINNILKELDEIFDSKENKKLDLLVEEVAKWVNKYGGNMSNITSYGLPELSQQIIHGGIDPGSYHMDIIYDNAIFDLFRKLLKEFAIQEVSNNNIDYGND
jgi:hypothetical protein